MKKFLATLLTVLMVFALAAPALAEGFPLTEEPVTFKMMGYKAGIQGNWDTLWFFDYMEEMTGVHFEFETPASDAFEERKLLALNSGDYADLFFGGNFSQEQIIKYGADEGILIPLEDLIEEYAPNVKVMFEAYPEAKSAVTAPDGHIYTLPQISMGVKWAPAFWYNQKWLENMDITEEDLPDTVEGLHELLLRFKNEDPNGNGEADEIPISFMGDSASGAGLSQLNSFILPGFGIMDIRIYFDQEGKVHYGMLEENYPAFAEYMKAMWEEGLVDPDMFSQDQATQTAKCKANVIGLACQAIPQNIYDVNDPAVAATYPNSPALKSAVSDTPLVPRSSTGVNIGTFAITDACPDPALVMKWVDYLYGVEGSWLVHYGPEGAIWEYADDEKYLCRYIQSDDGRSVEEVRGGDITPDCGTALPKWVRDDTEYRWDDAFQQYRLNHCMAKLADYAFLRKPNLFTTIEEQARLDVLMVDIEKYTYGMESKMITGEATAEEIAAISDTLKQMGIEEVMSIYQAAYDRWAAASN